MSKKAMKIEVDDRNMTAALRALSRLTGASFKKIVRYEAARILESAAKKTPAASLKKIRRSVYGKPAIWIGGKRVFIKDRHTKEGERALDRALGSAIRVDKALAAEFKKRRRSRGLQKKSFLQIAQKLGLHITVPGYVAKAVAYDGRDYPADTRGRATRGGKDYTLEMTNKRTYDTRIRGALRRSIRQRVSYFRQNLRRDVFKQTKQIAARYPGLS